MAQVEKKKEVRYAEYELLLKGKESALKGIGQLVVVLERFEIFCVSHGEEDPPRSRHSPILHRHTP